MCQDMGGRWQVSNLRRHMPTDLQSARGAFRGVSACSPKIVDLERWSLHVSTRMGMYIASDNAVTTSAHSEPDWTIRISW